MAEFERDRIRVDDYLNQHPPTGRIRRPIIIAGAYRTGTTALHRMMSKHFRVLLGWEAQIPTPPPATDLASRLADSRCVAQAEVVKILWEIDPELATMHEEPADQAAECVRAMGQSGVTGLWPAISDCSEYREWLLSSEAKEKALSAYERHNRCLLMFDADARWLLKAPMHSLFTEQILQVWPDAIFIQVNREHEKRDSSAIEFFSHLRGLSQPDRLGQHRREVASWIGPYLNEHELRVSQTDAPLYTISNADLRSNPELEVAKVLHWV